MVSKRANKKKYAETSTVSVDENDSDEPMNEENEPTVSKKSKVDEKSNDSNAGKKLQKGAKNAKSAKKVTENDEKVESEIEDSPKSLGSEKTKKSIDTSNGEEGDRDESELVMSGDDEDDEPVAKISKRFKANGKKSKGKGKKTAEASKEDDDDEEENGEEAEGEDSAKANGKKSKSNNKSNGKAKKQEEAKGEVDDEEADEEGEDDEEYEVQEIIDVKTEGGKKLYLVRWKGYTADDDTWEPKDSLSCKDLISKFEKKNTGKINGKGKKGGKGSAKSGSKSTAKGRKSDDKSAEDPSKVWEVEKIIDYAEDKNGFVYRIRWKGYGAQHDTWEPRANLFCDDLIEKFDKRIKELQNVSFKELREEPKKTRRLVNETAPRTNYHNKIGRTSKRSTVTKKRIYYGDSDE